MNWASDTGSLDFTTLQQFYRTGTLTVAEVVEAVYRRIAGYAETGVWIAVTPKAQALKQARELDTLLGGDPAALERMPLFGLPFAIKDNIDFASLPTTSACPAFAYTPSQSAEVVAQLVRAGAVPIGKANLDQFATGLVGTRSPYGVCRNPFNRAYISGGSSSGSAVAVAVGHVSFSLGTDTAGSGRVPAAFNNIFGIKPTYGLISTRGVAPANKSLDCVSIFALTAADAGRVAAVAYGSGAEKVKPGVKSAFVFGCPRADQLAFFGDEKSAPLFQAARVKLAELGGREVEIDYTPFAEAGKLLYGGPWLRERFSSMQDILKRNPEAVYPDTLRILEQGQHYSATDVFDGMVRLKHLNVTAAAVWNTIDVMLVPTTGTFYTVEEILKNGVELNPNLGYYTNFVNLLDYCAVALPAGMREDGLPFGVSLIAPALSDALLLNLATRFHAATGGKLGATAHQLGAVPTHAAKPLADTAGKVAVAVVGAHLRGQPLNAELTRLGAEFVAQTTTSSAYKLFALKNTVPPKPGLMFVGSDNGGAAIEIEVWNLPTENFGQFISAVKRPLGIGTLILSSGVEVKGFICEGYAIEGATEITHFGGWRNYLSSRER